MTDIEPKSSQVQSRPGPTTPRTIDPAAQSERWVDEHGDFLYSFAMMRLRDSTAAEDVVQETFLAALRQQGSERGLPQERGWLLGILKHKIYDHFRRYAREPVLSSADLDEESETGPFHSKGLKHGAWLPEQSPGDWPAHPAESLDQASFWQALHQCTRKLPRNTARAFLLRELDELDTAEICELLGITESHLWVLLHRARLGLRRCLQVNWIAKLK